MIRDMLGGQAVEATELQKTGAKLLGLDMPGLGTGNWGQGTGRSCLAFFLVRSSSWGEGMPAHAGARAAKTRGVDWGEGKRGMKQGETRQRSRGSWKIWTIHSLGLQRHPQKVFGPSKPTPNTF